MDTVAPINPVASRMLRVAADAVKADVVVVDVEISFVIGQELLLIRQLHFVVPLDELFLNRFDLLQIRRNLDGWHAG